MGILVDQTYDIGRIEDVHWNPWYSSHPNYIGFQQTYGVGFLIARTDWEYVSIAVRELAPPPLPSSPHSHFSSSPSVFLPHHPQVLNTFVFAMSVGYKFVESAEGSCNGNFVGIGADCCANASVMVEAADPWGIMIVNGEFTSFSGGFGPDIANHTQVVVSPSNKGAVRFVSSAFWGPSHQIATIGGSGSVGFESCIFNSWAAENATNAAAIQVYGGNALVRGSEFQTSHPGGQVHLFPGAKKVIVSENLAVGPWLMTDDSPSPKHLDLNNIGD